MPPNFLHKQLIDTTTPQPPPSLGGGATTPQPPPSLGGGATTPRIVGDASPPWKGRGDVSSPIPRQRWLKMATGDVDRAGDILVLDGMNAENFLKNPQFLWQHGASGSIINTIGKVLELRVMDNSRVVWAVLGPKPSESLVAEDGDHHAGKALYALVEYAPAEVSPLAEQVLQLHDAGMLPANSIGFRPIEYEANDFGGFTFTEWELIECSKVELPMNPLAVDENKSLMSDEEIEEAIENTIEWLLR